jgi:hypothetical protein
MEIGDHTSHSIIETIYACHTQQNGVQTSTSKNEFLSNENACREWK